MASTWKHSIVKLVVIALIICVQGCTTGSGTGGGSINRATFDLTVYMGDAPADGVVNFTMTVTNIQLVIGNNNYVVLSSPVTMEFTRNSGVFLPVSVANSIPSGPYTKAIITVSSPLVTALNPNTGVPTTLTPTLQSSTTTLTLANPITVDSNGGGIVTVDLDMANSLSNFDYVNNKVTVNPVFNVDGGNIPSTGQAFDTGTLESYVGTFTTSGATSFSVAGPSGSVNFVTDGTTQIVNATALSQILNGSIVEVDGTADTSATVKGTSTATRIEVKVDGINGGSALAVLEDEGYIASVTGNPVSQIAQISRLGTGNGAATAGTVTLFAIGAATNYTAQTDRVSLTGLPFTPTFSASTMRNGQDVSVDVSINTLHPFAANHVKLVEQTLTGVVSNYTAGTGGAATFTLTVPVDSVFALLNGNVNTTIDVFQQPTTLLAGITAVANGNTVRPRGLLYFDTVSGRYKLVCDRILAP